MNSESSQLEYNFGNFSDYSIELAEDVLIKRIKDLSEKHNISFTEALGVFKYLKDDDYYLKEINSAIYELDRTMMEFRSSICKELTDIKKIMK